MRRGVGWKVVEAIWRTADSVLAGNGIACWIANREIERQRSCYEVEEKKTNTPTAVLRELVDKSLKLLDGLEDKARAMLGNMAMVVGIVSFGVLIIRQTSEAGEAGGWILGVLVVMTLIYFAASGLIALGTYFVSQRYVLSIYDFVSTCAPGRQGDGEGIANAEFRRRLIEIIELNNLTAMQKANRMVVCMKCLRNGVLCLVAFVIAGMLSACLVL